jgi:hypothetical protein
MSRPATLAKLPTLSPLQCPLNHVCLVPLEHALLARLNEQIAQGTVHNRLGARVTNCWEAAVIGTDGVWIYQVVREVPQLLTGEAVAVDGAAWR